MMRSVILALTVVFGWVSIESSAWSAQPEPTAMCCRYTQDTCPKARCPEHPKSKPAPSCEKDKPSVVQTQPAAAPQPERFPIAVQNARTPRGMPKMPKMPKMPAMPAMPQMPAMPKMPSMPASGALPPGFAKAQEPLKKAERAELIQVIHELQAENRALRNQLESRESAWNNERRNQNSQSPFRAVDPRFAQNVKEQMESQKANLEKQLLTLHREQERAQRHLVKQGKNAQRHLEEAAKEAERAHAQAMQDMERQMVALREKLDPDRLSSDAKNITKAKAELHSQEQALAALERALASQEQAIEKSANALERKHRNAEEHLMQKAERLHESQQHKIEALEHQLERYHDRQHSVLEEVEEHSDGRINALHETRDATIQALENYFETNAGQLEHVLENVENQCDDLAERLEEELARALDLKGSNIEVQLEGKTEHLEDLLESLEDEIESALEQWKDEFEVEVKVEVGKESEGAEMESDANNVFFLDPDAIKSSSKISWLTSDEGDGDSKDQGNQTDPEDFFAKAVTSWNSQPKSVRTKTTTTTTNPFFESGRTKTIVEGLPHSGNGSARMTIHTDDGDIIILNGAQCTQSNSQSQSQCKEKAEACAPKQSSCKTKTTVTVRSSSCSQEQANPQPDRRPAPNPQPNPEPIRTKKEGPKDAFDDGKAKPIPPPIKDKPKNAIDPFGMLVTPSTLRPAGFPNATPFALTTQTRPIASTPIRAREEVLREMETLMEEMQLEMATLRQNIESVRNAMEKREVSRNQAR